MKLNVDFTELKLSASKMSGLISYMSALKEADMSYYKGLELAKDFALNNKGDIVSDDIDNVTITLFEEKVICFKGFSNIDKFDFKIL